MNKYDDPCSATGCTRVIGRKGGRGLCCSCLQKQKRAEHKRAPKRFCAVDGCDKPTTNPGARWCSMHYARVRNYGEPGPAEGINNPRGAGGLSSKGYWVRQVNGRRRPEHHWVMESILGRPLREFENVHHVNGVRSDNRPENLELWCKPQPSGQRAIDLARWVVENYPDLIAEAREAVA